MSRPQLPITPNEPLRHEPNLFGPSRPVYPAYWVKLGDQAKAARLDKGLSLAGGAHVLGLEHEELYQLERGGYSFAIKDVLAMLRGP
jgi:hypothetical protein